VGAGQRREKEKGGGRRKKEKKRKGKRKWEGKRKEREREKERGRGIAPAPIAAGGRAWPTGSRAARDETAARKKRQGTVGGKKEKMEQRLKSEIRTTEILGGD